MEGLLPDSAAARLLAKGLGSERFVLVDVGCSGGLDAGWCALGGRLLAFGFDPAVQEIERLAAEAADGPGEVRYTAGFVGLPAGHPLKGAAANTWRTDPWGRTSTWRTQELHRRAAEAAAEAAAPAPQPAAPDPSPEPAAEEAAAPIDDRDLMRRNRWSETRLVDPARPVVLSDFFDENGVDSVDFVKIDVDGADFEILQSLSGDIARRGVLGMGLEVGYHGVDDPQCNTFHNTDRFMRRHGFDLFDLTVRKYSLAALPAPYLFVKPYAAQTAWGRPFQGDALYLRDFNFPHLDRGADRWPDAKLLKLCILYCLFGQIDQAAETLVLFRERLVPLVDVDAVLDLLARDAQTREPVLAPDGCPPFADYRSYVAAFEADDGYFYGVEEKRAEVARVAAGARDEALRAKADLAAELERARAELAQARAAAAWTSEIAAELDRMRRTVSWRVTAPLRAAMRALKAGKA